MTNCTNANPMGITDYDIAQFAQLPGWQKLAQALNDVALQAAETLPPSRRGDRLRGQDRLVDAVGHLARGIAYMDCCPDCERKIANGVYVNTGSAPYVTEIKDGWLQGWYRCEQGHEWTCGYSLLAPTHW